MGTGIAGWVAVNRQAALNADPALDLGRAAASLTPGLGSCLAVPLVEGDTLIAVLALYREPAAAFSDDDVRLVELLAPRLTSSIGGAARVERETGAPAAPAPLKLVRLATSA
jgi:GAF domain-containing protein